MFRNRCLVKWIISSREAQLCDTASDLAMEKFFWPIAVFNGVGLAFFQCLIYHVINVAIELLFLPGFDFSHCAVLILTILSGPWTDFSLNSWIKQEMDDSLVNGFDLSLFSSLVDRILDGFLNWIFLFTNFHELICADTVFEVC